MSETVVLCGVDEVAEGTHGEASLSEDGILTGKIVECTFHFGTFDVTTGEPTGMPCEIPLKVYPVKVIDEQVCIEV
jgi:p-cumate 2,3-dioxygenase ferredoxin subunit